MAGTVIYNLLHVLTELVYAYRFSEDHNFIEPNDENALRLMNRCAERIMHEYSDIILAYGHGDEYTFVFKKSTTLFNRRPRYSECSCNNTHCDESLFNCSKIVTNVVSDFTAYYFFYWKCFFPSVEAQYLPSFGGKIMTIPNLKTIQDYLGWRQADCRIKNLYNTCFWALVHSGMTMEDAEKKLCVSS